MKSAVYISAYLKDDKWYDGDTYGRSVYNEMHSIPELNIREIQNHCQNVWCRDYMPIRRFDGQLIQFKYRPQYTKNCKKWTNRIPDKDKIHDELSISVTNSNIVLDGGGIEVLEDKAILSDRIFRDNKDNKDRSIDSIISEIKDRLGLEQLIIVPEYPYDLCGHVDAFARFIDRETVLINEGPLDKYDEKLKTCKSKLLKQWDFSFQFAFLNSGLKIKKMPVSEFKDTLGKQRPTEYLNFLKLDDLIIMPSFGKETEDTVAENILRELYNREVKTIDARNLIRAGGLINCVTWNY